MKILHVTLEAFVFGVPVVASDIGAVGGSVLDRHKGLLFRVGDAADLGAKIEWLARDRGGLARPAAEVPRVKSTTAYAGEIEAPYEHVRADRGVGPAERSTDAVVPLPPKYPTGQ